MSDIYGGHDDTGEIYRPWAGPGVEPQLKRVDRRQPMLSRQYAVHAIPDTLQIRVNPERNRFPLALGVAAFGIVAICAFIGDRSSDKDATCSGSQVVVISDGDTLGELVEGNPSVNQKPLVKNGDTVGYEHIESPLHKLNPGVDLAVIYPTERVIMPVVCTA